MTRRSDRLLLLLVIPMLLVAACKKDIPPQDPCENIDCNHGTCVDGTCVCDSGYTGSNCQINTCLDNCVNGSCNGAVCQCNEGFEGTGCATQMNDKFVGNFTLTETCSPTGSGSYPVYITDYPFAHTTFNIRNLINQNQTTAAYISSSNSLQFRLDSLTTMFYDGGFGHISPDFDTIWVEYRYGNSPNYTTCNAVLIRQ